MRSEEFNEAVQKQFEKAKELRAELYEKYPKLDAMLAAQQIATVTSVRTGQDIREEDVMEELQDLLKIDSDEIDDLADIIASTRFSQDLLEADEAQMSISRARDFVEETTEDMGNISLAITDMEEDVETALDRIKKELDGMEISTGQFKDLAESDDRADATRRLLTDLIDDREELEQQIPQMGYLLEDYDEVKEMRDQLKDLVDELEELSSGPVESRERGRDLLKQGFLNADSLNTGYDEDKFREMLGKFRKTKTYERATEGMTIVRKRSIPKSEPVADSDAARDIHGLGKRSIINIPETGVQVMLNDDQRGDARRTIAGLRSSTQNPDAFEKMDEWLSGKSPNISRDQHEEIFNEFADAANRDLDLGDLRHVRDAINLAAMSEDGKWKTPKAEGGFDGRPKPAGLTKRQRADLLEWGQNDADDMLRRRFVGLKEDDVSPKGWMMLRNDFGGGMRSATGGGSINETRDTGKRAQRGRPVGAGDEKKFKGKPFSEVKPDNWDQLTADERFDELLTNLHPSKTGLREVDFNRLRKELVLESLRSDQESERARRRAQRREALANVRVSKPTERPAARPAPVATTAEQAKKQRQQEVTKIGNRVARISSNIDKQFERDEERGLDPNDESHRDIWASLTDILEDSDELTLSQAESIAATLDDYLEEASGADLTATESNSVQNAQVLRADMGDLIDRYRLDPNISKGDSSAAVRIGGEGEEDVATTGRSAARFLSEGGMRSFTSYKPSPTVQEYAEARRSQGLRSQQAGRTVINEEATFFKAIEDSLAKEIREARNANDSRTVKGLELLQRIMRRQDSGKVSDRRTNAGALWVTADEADEILDAMMFALDRQMETGGSRVDLYAQFVEIISAAAMGTFISKTTSEVSSRTQARTNSQGRQVNIPNQ